MGVYVDEVMDSVAHLDTHSVSSSVLSPYFFCLLLLQPVAGFRMGSFNDTVTVVTPEEVSIVPFEAKIVSNKVFSRLFLIP